MIVSKVTHILQLHPSITPEVIAEAAAAGIAGVKVYPQGTAIIPSSHGHRDKLTEDIRCHDQLRGRRNII